MQLTGPDIERRIRAGDIVIEPYDVKHLGPNSYDLHLSEMLVIYSKHLPLHIYHETMQAHRRSFGNFRHQPPPVLEPLDIAVKEKTVEFQIGAEGFVLYPGVLYLGSTVEHTETRHLVPYLDGRSSAGRIGLTVHLTAGRGDNFFLGHWTLELTVVQPLRVYAGARICQISYQEVVGEEAPYKGQYQSQEKGPKSSGIWRDYCKPPE